MAASPPDRHNTTWLIDDAPVIEQGLVDLTTWVEEGIRPAATTFEYGDGKVTLPATAAGRGGIQPVVHVTANGGARTLVRVGESVGLEVVAEVPAGAGTIIGVKWDVDGSGAYPFVEALDGSSPRITLGLTHAWPRPGTYFVTALVESHRERNPDGVGPPDPESGRSEGRGRLTSTRVRSGAGRSFNGARACSTLSSRGGGRRMGREPSRTSDLPLTRKMPGVRVPLRRPARPEDPNYRRRPRAHSRLRRADSMWAPCTTWPSPWFTSP